MLARVFVLIVVTLIASSELFRSFAIAQRCWEDAKNRDGDTPKFPILEDFRRQTEHIVKANQVLRLALEQFLDHRDANLTVYLNIMINRSEPFKDEYDVVIPVYKKVFRFILVQHCEVIQHNYAIKQFDKDKLDLCSVARYLSHQPNVADRKSLMKRMGEALGYKCHPCTPYKRRESGPVEVPDTSDLVINYDDPPPCNTSLLTGTAVSSSTNITVETPKTSVLSTVGITQNITFPQYYPCYYDYDDDGSSVECEKTRIREVKDAFHAATSRDLKEFDITLRPPEDHIPADVIGSHRIRRLQISCPRPAITKENPYRYYSHSIFKLKVDPEAFASTKQVTKSLTIKYCDIAELDFGFLSGFESLADLEVFAVSNLDQSFWTLPQLPKLSNIEIEGVPGLNKLTKFPVLAKGLEYLKMQYLPGYDTAAAKRMVNWLVESSFDTLETLEIRNASSLTEIPGQLASFQRLRRVTIRYANIPSISAGALNFSAPIESLDLLSNSIKTIMPGAFHGNFTNVRIILTANKLTRFRAEVFQSVLEQMIQGNNGLISVALNPLECTGNCHLAWLVRDRRHLLGKVIKAKCTDAVDGYLADLGIDKLRISEFKDCPLF